MHRARANVAHASSATGYPSGSFNKKRVTIDQPRGMDTHHERRLWGAFINDDCNDKPSTVDVLSFSRQHLLAAGSHGLLSVLFEQKSPRFRRSGL